MGKGENASTQTQQATAPKKAETPPQQQHHATPIPVTGKGKGPQAAPGGCHAWHCKAQAKRFDFCDEHYDHFKFGLIKKSGEPVPDYEKKFGHYQAYKAKQGSARKVA